MTDLISRQAALEEIQGFYPPKVANETEAEAINRVGWECAINCIEAYLRTVKPVDPVKHGKWIKDGDTYALYKCSECNDFCTEAGYANCIPEEQMYKAFKFCPNCGARMDGE